MENKEVKKVSRLRLKIILGIILSFIVVIIYIGCSMLYKASNTHNLQTIFTEESLYSSSKVFSSDSAFILYAKTGIDYLTEVNNPILYNIDSIASDSVENENQEMTEQSRIDDQAVDDSNNAVLESQSTEGDNTSSTGLSSMVSDIIHMINNIRADHGLQLLNSNPILSTIALSRSQDMINRDYFSHYTPEGKNIANILAENDIMYACMAENLGHASPPSWASPDAIINLWMNSPSHRENLLNPHFGQLGLGVTDGNGRRVVTLIFMNR